MSAEPLQLNTIEALARALLAQCSPASGSRSSGTASITSTGGLSLPRNAYLAPVLDGQLRPEWLFKVGPDPSTVATNGSGGDWVFTNGQTRDVAIISNLGGARHNLPAGTRLRFAPELAGFAPVTAALVGACTGGVNGLIQHGLVWAELDVPNIGPELFRAHVPHMPAIMVAWLDTAPLEGRSSGVSRGATRVGRKAEAMRESFDLYVFGSGYGSDLARRSEALVVMQAVTRLLTDRHMNIDREALSVYGGGVEIIGRRWLVKSQEVAAMVITLRLNVVLEPIDERSFTAWELTNIQGAPVDGAPADWHDPQPEDLVTVNVDVDMTPT